MDYNKIEFPFEDFFLQYRNSVSESQKIQFFKNWLAKIFSLTNRKKKLIMNTAIFVLTHNQFSKKILISITVFQRGFNKNLSFVKLKKIF
jgi:hypothetical protein